MYLAPVTVLRSGGRRSFLPPGVAALHLPGANAHANFNDAKITSLYVNGEGSVSDIQDDAPNAPAGGKFDVTLEDGGR